MIEPNIPDLNLDELMDKIRAEVKQREESGKIPSGSIPRNWGAPSSLYIKTDLSEVCSIPDLDKFEIKDHYHINEFLKFRDRNFVMIAYRGILRRRPDSGGLEHFLGDLRSGKMTKAEILGRLRYAPEGRVKKTKVDGLFWNFLIQSSFGIPVLGYFSRLTFGIGNLPLILQNMRVFEERASTRLESQRNDLAIIQSKLDPLLNGKLVADALENKADRADFDVLKDDVAAALESKADRADFGVLKDDVADALESKADRADFGVLKDDVAAALESKADKDLLEEITDQIREILRQTRDHKLNILDQQRRLMFLLEETRKRLPEPISTEQIKAMLTEEDQVLNAMYVSFEDQFRGTREDIKKRQAVYFPYLEEAGLGDENLPILDVGCGRGEWLELLKEKGFKARGVDVNALLVQECSAKALDAVRGDAVDFLRNLKSGSMGVITGFHIVEHLPMRKMISFFDEAFRVLKPGGIVIFETPNPENVLVGSCTFYSDPTHKNPIPPDTLMFLLEYRGFISSEIVRLNPLNFVEYDKDDPLKDLIYRFNMAQDYAVITRKAA
jgi:2-polyprenyl-3-methyl-5-hydroxy-6-metoxy-1,4-benzoquinol methylase